ncbi:MAG: hypothetical protein RLZZ593_1220 [Bacteroidota bacterium]
MKRILFLAYLATYSLYGQFPSNDIMNMAVFKDSVYVFTKSSIYVSSIEQTDFKERPFFRGVEDSFRFDKMEVLSDGIYFTISLGGYVWKLHNDSLQRIDRSFEHRMQINSTQFVHNDQIYRYGGYGFWSNRNFFTKYDPLIREWEVIPPINTVDIPEGTKDNHIVYNGKKVIVFGGNKLDQKDLATNINTNEVWQYDLDKMKWENLGEIQVDIHSMEENFYIMYQDKLILQSDPFLYVFDPFNNKVLKYRQNSIHKKILGKGISKFHNGKFYLLMNANNVNMHFLETRLEDEFFGPVIEEYPFYKKNRWPWLLMLLPAGLFGFIGYRVYKRNKSLANSALLRNDGLVYKRVFYKLDQVQVEVLECLLSAESGVETSSLMKLIENPEHNYSHNMRTKNLVISELNYKLRTVFKIEQDLIESHKSERDKRIIIYTIDKQRFSKRTK